MNDKPRQFIELEQKSPWPAQSGALLKKVLPLLRLRAISDNLSAEQYDKRLSIAGTFFKHLENALGWSDFQMELAPGEQQTPPGLWLHQKQSALQDFSFASGVNKITLRECVAFYLNYAWLHCHVLDWLLLDCLVLQQILDERDAVHEKFRLKKNEQARLFHAEYQSTGPSWITWTGGLIVVSPLPVLAWLFVSGAKTMLFAGGVLYGVLLIGFLSFLPVMIRERKEKMQKIADKAQSLQHLLQAYRYCEPPVAHPQSVEKFLLRAQDHGIAVDGVLLALIGSIKEKNPHALLTA